MLNLLVQNFSAYYMPRRVLGAKDFKMKKTKSQPSWNLHFSSERQATNQQINYSVLSAAECYKEKSKKALSDITCKQSGSNPCEYLKKESSRQRKCRGFVAAMGLVYSEA